MLFSMAYSKTLFSSLGYYGVCSQTQGVVFSSSIWFVLYGPVVEQRQARLYYLLSKTEITRLTYMQLSDVGDSKAITLPLSM